MAYQKKITANKDVSNEETNPVKVENDDIDHNKPKTYKNEDTITCKSITNGGLYVTGDKSGILYRWADYGDTEEVEYQDLVYMIRAHKPSVFRPRFVIEDEEFLAQHPDLNDLYNSLYSTGDLVDVLNLPVPQMRSAIEQLPSGALDAIKGVAASRIMSGKYDSVQKIKALDEIFDTHLLLTLAQG